MATATQTPPKQGEKQEQKKPSGVAELITANIGAIQRIMPKHLNVERMIQLAISFSRKPELRDCTPASFVGVFMEAAKLGLPLDSRGLAYAVPFWNNKVTPNRREAQFMIGYKGLIQLALNSRRVTLISAYEVYEQDTFDFEYGSHPRIYHKPCMVAVNRGPLKFFYVTARLKDSPDVAFRVMPIEDIEKIRDKFSKAAKSGPWVDNFSAMAMKTVCIRLCKFLPSSPDLERAIAMDEANEAQIPQHLDLLSDLNTVEGVYTVEDPDVPDMERVKEQVKAGNGKPAAKAAEEKKPDEPPAEKTQPEATPAKETEKEQLPTKEENLAADQALIEQEDPLYAEARSQILRAPNMDAKVAIYNKEATKGVLSPARMTDLQGVLRDERRKVGK